MATLEDHITAVETLLAQTAGVSVQKYAEPRIAQLIGIAFNTLFDQEYWPQFRHWQLVTLDGTTGFPTEDSEFQKFGHILNIYPSGEQRRLSRLPVPFNPWLASGTAATWVEPQAGTKLFRVWPLTAVGQLYVQGKRHPGAFALDTEIDFDDDCLDMLAAWQYAVTDGDNPAQATMLQAMYDKRLIDLKADIIGNIPTDFDPRFGSVPNQWQEWPN